MAEAFKHPPIRRPGWPVGSFAGVPLRVQPSTLVVTAVTLVVWTQAFGGMVPADANPFLGAAFAATAYLGFLLSLFAHEFAHVFAARALGYGCKGVTLSPFGMFAHIAPDWRAPEDEAIVAAAGPALSLVLSLAFLPMMAMPGLPGALSFVLHWVNLLLAVFNLVPCFPMDGGRLLRAFAWRLTGDIARGTAIAARVGWATGALIVAYGAYVVSLGNPLGLVTILIALLMVTYANREVRKHRHDALLARKTAASIMHPFGQFQGTGDLGLTLHPASAENAGEPSLVLWRQSGLETIGRLPISTVRSVPSEATVADMMEAFMSPAESGWPILLVGDSEPLGYVTMGQIKRLVG